MSDPKEYIDCENVCRCNGSECDKLKCPIWNAPAADVAPVVHGKWIPTTKHKWRTREDGEIDEFAWDYEYHNGVICDICGFNPCIHCHPDYDENDDCNEHFVCSECGRHEKEQHLYCHCGAKMDGGAHEKNNC